MARTSIEWTDRVWNPVTGCTKVSAGCRNCYAETIAGRFWSGRPFGYVLCHPERLEQPLKWRKPSRVFVNSMSDLFHESVPFEFIDRVFRIMALADWHTFQVLTKRPARMLEYMGASSHRTKSHDWSRIVPLPNVWLGVSVEDQRAADERIPLLLQTPASVRFVSAEPLIGRLCISDIPIQPGPGLWKPLAGIIWEPHPKGSIPRRSPKLDWVICGGESGPGARPMHPDWARSLRDQCQAAGVAFFFKQWGEWAPCPDADWHGIGPHGKPRQTCISPSGERAGGFLGEETAKERELEGWRPMQRIGKPRAGRLLDGREWSEFPEVRHA